VSNSRKPSPANKNVTPEQKAAARQERQDASLRATVLRRLAVLEDLAEHGDPDALLPMARTELHRLADGWRLLLNVHQPGVDGRCRACPGPLRRRRWPCPVWLMAYQHLIGDGLPGGRRRHRLRRIHLLRRMFRRGREEPPEPEPEVATDRHPTPAWPMADGAVPGRR
jgi:hypothetical protein